jgi:hypothetical protein
LINRGYGIGEVDFINSPPPSSDITAIVTNPPFNLAEQFIRHAILDLQIPYCALLLKATYWHAKSRISLFKECPPAVIYPLTWRLDFMNRGRPTMECSWIVWDRSRVGTKYELLEKPQVTLGEFFS